MSLWNVVLLLTAWEIGKFFGGWLFDKTLDKLDNRKIKK